MNDFLNKIFIRIKYMQNLQPSECMLSDKKICSNDKAIGIMKKILKEDANNKSDEEIVKTLEKQLNCNSESCIYNSREFLKEAGSRLANELKNDVFNPYGPQDSETWLSNVNIDEVMDMWEKKFNYKHIYFQMIDFSRMNTELAHVNLYNLSKKYDSMAVVINTDVSSGPGIHWFCLYTDFKASPITIEYYNTSGEPPRPEINNFISKQLCIFDEHNVKAEEVVVSRYQIQTDNASCGPHSLFYIYSRLNGIPYILFTKYGNITDGMAVNFRKTIFRDNR